MTTPKARLEIVPITFKAACAYVAQLHRHNKPPRGHKFSIGVEREGVLCGVAQIGRPIARALDNGRNCEVIRTCTDGTPNANSKLYGAARKAAFAMGYLAVYTYTRQDESGSSLRAAGFVVDATLAPRGNWAASTTDPKLLAMRDPKEPSQVPRLRWVCSRAKPEQTAKESVTSYAHALRAKLEAHFSEETAMPGGSRRCPSTGHCAVVAAIVHAEGGGDLVSTYVGEVSHWFNRLAQDVDFDITGDQFGRPPVQVTRVGKLYPGTRARFVVELNKETLSRAVLLADRAGMSAAAATLRKRLAGGSA